MDYVNNSPSTNAYFDSHEMNNSLHYLESTFWNWHLTNNATHLKQVRALRQEALDVIVGSINAGEILDLDGGKSPMSEKIKMHHGLTDMEMNDNWIGSAQDWTCPCCDRTKFQISRIGNKEQILAKLVVHHDHMGDALKASFNSAFEQAGTNVQQREGYKLVERIGYAFAAHENVLVCEDCNNADTTAKRIVEAPGFFTFTIGQIRQFILSRDHQPHDVNPTRAKEIWLESKPAYELRIRLIEEVARAAATDRHWYEPHAQSVDPIPVLGSRRSGFDSAVHQWVSFEELCKALSPKRPQFNPDLSRWRTSIQKVGRRLPDNYLAMLCSETVFANAWNSLPVDWHCPVCSRSKYESTYVGEKGKVCFYIRSNPGRGAWAKATKICNHCQSTLMSLKSEISARVGMRPSDSYGFVAPEELKLIIVGRPHSPHLIRKKEALSLVTSIVHRLS